MSEHELAQVRSFNRKLAWLPRFRVRNRLMPRLMQVLLQASQIGGDAKLSQQGVTVETRTVAVDNASVRVRIIRPPGPVKGVVLDYHGGGWVLGNAQMNDDFNIAIANTCHMAVVSVDYRLAVSTPVEGLMDDCLCAARWLLDEANSEFGGVPVVVVGESAGGHLAASTLLRLKAYPGLLERVSGALLYYGVYDLTGTASVRSAPRDTLVLDGPGMVDALRLLTPGLTDQARQRPPLSPLYGDLSGMPPALMFVGDLDPLRDDTLSMAARWAGSAPVDMHLLAACPHGFIHFPTDLAARVLAYSREWITARIG